MCNTYSSEHTDKLAKALIAVQRELQPAIKDSTNAYIHNRYASLSAVMASCRTLLLDNGIWLTQLPVPAPLELGPGYIGLMTKLTHAESGQWQSSLLVSPLPKNDPQGMGSALTYARRYSLVAMLGIIVDDDDAESACVRPAVPAASPAPAPDQPESDTPCIAGVRFVRFTDANGSAWIRAEGDTQPNSKSLASAGFRWNSRQKAWFKPSPQPVKIPA